MRRSLYLNRNLDPEQNAGQEHCSAIASEAHCRRYRADVRCAQSGSEPCQRQHCIQQSPHAQQFVAASTTAPVAVHQPQRVQLPPVSAAQSSAQPSPAAILSLSDLRMKDGTVTLPPVNESAASSVQGALAPGHAQDSSPQGNGNPAAKSGATQRRTGFLRTKRTRPGSAASAVKAAGPGSATSAVKSNASAAGPAVAVIPASAMSAPAQGANLSSGSSGTRPALTQIALPKDGHFSAVVVGDSLGDIYPEAADAWSGRIAYTAYLHVGLAKSWIMQYSLPRDADASAGGTVARLDAPWPYNIVRPNLDARLS